MCGGQSAGLFCCAFYRGYYKKGNKMNLKEKWTKQNNSVKMLLRKLKRHDTVVVAVAVVIAVILCGGLIYLSTPVVAASAKDELVEAQTKDNEQTIEKLDELSEYLNGLDKSITESKDSMTSFYEKDGEKNTEKMTNTVTEKVGNLGNDLAGLHDTIIRTGTDIDKLREIIEKGGEDSDKSITEKFTNIYNNLEEIENTYNKTHENTKSLIEELENALKSGDDKLSKELLDRYKELLDELTKSNEKLTEQNSESLKEFKDQIGNLNTEVTKKLTEISTDINTNIDNQFNSMNISFESDMTGLKAYLSGELSNVNDKVDQVFQRVSKGKKLLASTLLTKNVQIREDATFAEIAKAIEDIPMEVVLGQDEVSGEVIYQYHYHVDGQGNVCDEEYVPIDRQGGCYTHEYIHTHTDDCYNKTITYTYGTAKDVEATGWSHADWGGNNNYYYYCHYCGKRFVNDNPEHSESTTDRNVAQNRAQNMPRETVTKTLKCTKPEGTLLGYETTCNLLHGQIVAAKIVFSDGYDRYNTSTDVLAPSDTNVTASLMRAPAAGSSISTSAFWDDDVNWDFELEDDNNSLEKEKLKMPDAKSSETEGSDPADGKQTNNENGDNNDDNKENGDDAGNDKDNASTGSSNDDSSDEHSDGDVSQTDNVVMENAGTQSTSDSGG